jgi:hypothetical protein
MQNKQGGAQPARRFRLVRYFSIASAVAILLVTLALTWLYGWKAQDALLAQGEQKNAAQLKLILNHLTDVDRSTLLDLAGRTAAPAAVDAAVARMSTLTARSVAGTSIIKFKLYAKTGMTVFSTEARQIGEDRATYPGFVMALGGRASSSMSHRDSFVAIGGNLRDVDVIGSYLPVTDDKGRIIGVVEVYDNVTPLASAIRATRWQVMGATAAMLSLLYFVLLLVVDRADRILRDNERALQVEVEQRVKTADELKRSLQATEAAQRATEQAYASALTARREAEAANNAKSEFLQTMSESLRTPVNRSIGLLDVLTAGLPSENQRSQVAAVRAQAISLLDLLSENVARAGAGAQPAAPR